MYTTTSKNLDRLAEFLTRELNQPYLAPQIPDGAHIFHGSINDDTLTQANLDLAAKILLGMTLGYVEEAPLILIMETASQQHQIINLSAEWQRREAASFVTTFQQQTQQQMVSQVEATLAV